VQIIINTVLISIINCKLRSFCF